MKVENELSLERLQNLIPVFKLRLATEEDAIQQFQIMARSRKPLDEGSVIAVDETGKNFAAFRKGKPVVMSR